MPEISVIIVNWRSKDYVRQCLSALSKYCPIAELEIIVVDSASYDGCGDMLAKEFPRAVFVQLDQNVGFGRANNAGFERATGEYVWLLNPDTEVVGDAATTLRAALQARNDVGMVGARLLNCDGSLQTACVQSLPTPLNQALDSELLRHIFGVWGFKAFRSGSQPVEVEAISGACMMLRRVDFDRVGRFERRYFMYCEDMDLCFKVRKHGLKILYVPEAGVLHHGGASAQKQFSKFSVVLTQEAVTSYFTGNYGIAHAWIYRFCMGVSALVRIPALLAGRLFPRASHRKNSASLKKWITILRWCLGGERWAKAYSPS